MIRTLSLILFGAFLSACSSTTLIVTTAKNKFKIKEEMSVAVTRLGESYPYDENCKSTCKDCDPALNAARWWIDSIGDTELILRFEYSFHYDTITNKEFKSRLKSERKKNMFKVLSIEKRPAYVYKIPVEIEYRSFVYDSIATLTYSEKPSCYKGSPIKAIFNSPNRIRKVDMQGAQREIKR
ncbi:MAG: hypothetical protein A3D92_24785 [Bacteroidetes bacterium RIFCSPHIGHO2_02_FULL_44_7]|nr:MAG: hypothetical protein A3D92_24785 [Bacteroidetes bacterium RIFCSPHIGHO2_02_FULL_44_7]